MHHSTLLLYGFACTIVHKSRWILAYQKLLQRKAQGHISDTPACRKAAGLLSYSATLGCSKCLKKFPGSVGCKDYSGSMWPPRNNTQHRDDIKMILRSSTKTEREQQESLRGCYSVLLDLPYFDTVRMCIIDPMHNLYLGSTKHILKRVWLEQENVTSRVLIHSAHSWFCGCPSKCRQIKFKLIFFLHYWSV